MEYKVKWYHKLICKIFGHDYIQDWTSYYVDKTEVTCICGRCLYKMEYELPPSEKFLGK